MAKGRLSQKEKYLIQGMQSSMLPVEQIAKELGRTKKTVQNYIDGELDELQETIVKSQIQQEEEKQISKKKKKKNKPKRTKSKSEEAMLHKTDGGQEVVLMTEAGSSLGDVAHEFNKPTMSRTARGAVWNINEQRLMCDEDYEQED
jgi:IS30 family transposase